MTLERKHDVIKTTIAASGTKSAAINKVGYALLSVQLPAAFTGTTLTFEGSHDGTTYAPVYDGAGAALSVAVGTSRIVPLPAELASVRYLKLVSGSSEAAERTLYLNAQG